MFAVSITACFEDEDPLSVGGVLSNVVENDAGNFSKLTRTTMFVYRSLVARSRAVTLSF